MEAVSYTKVTPDRIFTPVKFNKPSLLDVVQTWLESEDAVLETRFGYGICAFASFYLLVKVLQSII